MAKKPKQYIFKKNDLVDTACDVLLSLYLRGEVAEDRYALGMEVAMNIENHAHMPAPVTIATAMLWQGCPDILHREEAASLHDETRSRITVIERCARGEDVIPTYDASQTITQIALGTTLHALQNSVHVIGQGSPSLVSEFISASKTEDKNIDRVLDDCDEDGFRKAIQNARDARNLLARQRQMSPHTRFGIPATEPRYEN